ncbi:MAG TPA: GNAT family N-acetyltransferase [Acidimicrobiia bacterium]|jgi:RimJ/RimL family protein N-acetyltransferase|nr:GNAT family N-acetyltransferase [Acidimicrobiia bacterium]
MTRSIEHTRRATPPLSYVLERRVNRPSHVVARTLRDRSKIAPASGFALRDGGTLVVEDPLRPSTHPLVRGQESWRAGARLLNGRGQVVARVDIEVVMWTPGSMLVQLRPVDANTHRWSARRARRYFALAHAGADRLERVLNDEGARRVARRVPFQIRPIEVDDLEGLRALFWRLSPESRYYRFLAPVRRPQERFLHHLAEVDHEARDAIVAVIDDEIVGVARYDRDRSDPRNAEVAVVVEDAWHRNGIATRLGFELSKTASRRGIEQFTATVAADNRAIATFVGSLPVQSSWAWDGGQRQLAIPLAHHMES